ncbi:MAG: hypothetical protein ACLGHN_08750 [Bacteriovoracia bacterium]
MIFKILLPLLVSSTAFGFDLDFKTVNDRVPLEFNLLFNSLKTNVKTPSDKLKLIGITKELDANLGFLDKEHIFFLMKSEVIKNVLEYRHQKVRAFDMTTFLLERLEEEFEKKEKYLSPFSKWIWRSILAELNFRKKMGLITQKSFNPATFDGPNRAEALRFAKYLNYLLPWIDKMDSLTAAEFNELTTEVSWATLRRLNERSILFKRYASTSEGDTRVQIFNIPGRLLEFHPEEIKRIQSDEAPLTLKEKSAKEKTQASKEVQAASPDDLSPLSDEVQKELEEKAP